MYVQVNECGQDADACCERDKREEPPCRCGGREGAEGRDRRGRKATLFFVVLVPKVDNYLSTLRRAEVSVHFREG